MNPVNAMRVAARCHEGALQRPERIPLAAHQLGEHLGDVLRLTRRYRYVVDIGILLRATSGTAHAPRFIVPKTA
jgi:hypothetical protein